MNTFKLFKAIGSQLNSRNQLQFLHTTKKAACWSWPAPDAVKDPSVKDSVEELSIKHNIPQERNEIEYSTEEWHYVERLFPSITTVPVPDIKPGEVTASGYRAPYAKLGDYPYYIGRTSNYMPRVHLHHNPLFNLYKTVISGIEGDVFEFAKDIKAYLIEIHGHELPITLNVKECFQKVYIDCDVVNDVKQFLYDKGF